MVWKYVATVAATLVVGEKYNLINVNINNALELLKKNSVFCDELKIVVQNHGVAIAVAIVVVVAASIIFGSEKLPPVPRVDLTFGPLSKVRVKTTVLADPNRKGYIQCYSPGTLQFLGEVRAHSGEEVKEVVYRARELQKTWVKTSYAERRRVLKLMKKIIVAQQDDIVRLSCIDSGKARVDAMFGEVLASLGKIDWVVAEGEKVLARDYRPVDLTSIHKQAFVEYGPLPNGVLGVIAPFNYPFYNLYNHIISGLFAGNAVVLKMSEFTAWSGEKFIRIAKEALQVCGHNPDLVQLVQGFGDAGASLVTHTDKVIFTGSPGVGKAVMAGAAPTLTPLVLELGGKDPVILCEDVKVDDVVAMMLRGSFQNSGQNCVGIERIYAYEAIYDEFVRKAVAATKKIRVGPTVDPVTGEFTKNQMGSVISTTQLGYLIGLVEDAVSKGAKVECGGHLMYAGATINSMVPAAAAVNVKDTPKRKGSISGTSSTANQWSEIDPEYKDEEGIFFAPTVISGVTHEMKIANEECFGPIMCIFKVENNDDELAISRANSTVYGLGASVFSANVPRANRIASRIKSGMVGVNAYGLNYLVQSLPFGGIGMSGFNRFSGPEGLRECCTARSIVTDRFSFLSIPTPVPPVLQYPLKKNAPGFVKGLLQFQFADTIADYVKGIYALATKG